MKFCPGANIPTLLSAFACSIILTNFSSFCSNPNPDWACSINLSRGPLTFFISQTIFIWWNLQSTILCGYLILHKFRVILIAVHTLCIQLLHGVMCPVCTFSFSFRPGQPTQKCSLSSTIAELHILHVLCSTGRQAYLPFSICNGLSGEPAEICVLSLLFFVHILQSHHSLL